MRRFLIAVELIELNDLMNDTLQLYNDKMTLINKPSCTNSISVNHQTSSSPPTLLDFSSPVDNAPTVSSSPPQDSGKL